MTPIIRRPALTCLPLIAACLTHAGINAWTEVKPAVVLPAGRNGTLYGTGWNTWTYRPEDNSLLFYDRYVGEEFPNTIYGNALTAWDLTTNRIQVLSISDTAPLERHTYESFAHTDGEDAVYMLSGATRGCGSDGKFWRYSFAGPGWKAEEVSIPDHYGCEVHMHQWKQGKALVFVDGWNKVMHFDLTTRTWSAPEVTRPSAVDVYEAKSVWDDKRDRWVFWGGNNGSELAAYDPAARKFSLLPVKGARPASHGHMGIAYIPKHDVFLVSGGVEGKETWAYAVATETWTRLPDADGPAGQTSLFYSEQDDKVYRLDACQGGCSRRMTLEYRPSGTAVFAPVRKAAGAEDFSAVDPLGRSMVGKSAWWERDAGAALLKP